MITISKSVRIFIGSAPIDMRKSIDGLKAIVKDELDEDPYSGHHFVFVSRRCDPVKIPFFGRGAQSGDKYQHAAAQGAARILAETG